MGSRPSIRAASRFAPKRARFPPCSSSRRFNLNYSAVDVETLLWRITTGTEPSQCNRRGEPAERYRSDELLEIPNGRLTCAGIMNHIVGSVVIEIGYSHHSAAH